MSDLPQTPESGETPRIHPVQEMMDNIWFIFFASGVIILVFYIIWGLIDLVGRPTLP